MTHNLLAEHLYTVQPATWQEETHLQNRIPRRAHLWSWGPLVLSYLQPWSSWWRHVFVIRTDRNHHEKQNIAHLKHSGIRSRGMKILNATKDANLCAICLTPATVPTAVAKRNKAFQNQWLALHPRAVDSGGSSYSFLAYQNRTSFLRPYALSLIIKSFCKV